jgi:hypothetical protein
MKVTNLYLLPAITILATACSDPKPTEEAKRTSDSIALIQPTVNPPIKGVDVPSEEFIVSAEKGDTLYAVSGAIVLFPQNAFVDKNGQPVKGDVTVSYRDFTDPVEFFLAGIPMQYDSAGTQYLFESSGMCELKASKDGKELYVNAAAKPQIHLPAANDNTASSLYYLDQQSGKWINKGKEDVTQVSKKAGDSKKSYQGITQPTLVTEKGLEKPVMPSKVTDPGRVIEIEIVPGSYPELDAYNNLKFEIDPADKHFSAKDGEEEWSDISLAKGAKEGMYTIKFSNAKRKVSYQARPVLDGKDYAAALKAFEKKQAEYQLALTKRLAAEAEAKKNAKAEEKNQQAQLTALQKENDRIGKLNKLIAIRNKEIEEQNKKTIAKNKSIEEKNALETAKQANYDRQVHVYQIYSLLAQGQTIPESYTADEIGLAQKMLRTSSQQAELMRSFEADRFGIWNCDQARIQREHVVNATFSDEAGKRIGMERVSVLYKGLNGIATFGPQVIRVSENNTAIWGVTNEQTFVYLNYSDFNSCGIKKSAQSFTFQMHSLPADQLTTAEIRKIVEQ